MPSFSNASTTFHHIPIPDATWDAVGDNLSALRLKGIPLADTIIATVGIENQVEVWSRDPHFQMIQTALPLLKLYQES